MTTALVLYAASAAIVFVAAVAVPGRPVTYPVLMVALIVGAFWPITVPLWAVLIMLDV